MSIFKTAIALSGETPASVFRQPRWLAAVAVACVTGSTMAATASAQTLGERVLTAARQIQPIMEEDSSRLGGKSIFGGDERLPSISDQQRLVLPPLAAATTAMDEIGNSSLPESFTTEAAAHSEVLNEQIEQRDPTWAWSTYHFSAPNTFSNPLYFEDVMLERHGHERFPAIQPVVSGARFFATVPMLPYLMTVRPPCECDYKMGHFRSGDCVYPYLQRPPYERKAAVVQALSTAGAAVALP